MLSLSVIGKRSHDPSLAERVRVLETWGPYQIQPIVARADLPPELRRDFADVLCRLAGDPRVGAALAEFGVRGFVAIDETMYTTERSALQEALRPEVALAALA